ncbi:hypothetical protein C8J57DRAFT_1242867 [Mycena rebaudengoi]|nr:hypothetical protein C8J57DRAFT_1242867 [Mycena rebaudengoi]
MVQLSAVFVTLCAAACALAGSVPAKRQTNIPQCAVDTVQYLFWVNTVGGVLQSSRDTILGAEALAVVGILNDINFSLVSAVANGNSVAQTEFTKNIGPVFDEANKLLTEADKMQRGASPLTAIEWNSSLAFRTLKKRKMVQARTGERIRSY